MERPHYFVAGDAVDPDIVRQHLLQHPRRRAGLHGKPGLHIWRVRNRFDFADPVAQNAGIVNPIGRAVFFGEAMEKTGCVRVTHSSANVPRSGESASSLAPACAQNLRGGSIQFFHPNIPVANELFSVIATTVNLQSDASFCRMAGLCLGPFHKLHPVDPSGDGGLVSADNAGAEFVPLVGAPEVCP